MTCSPSIRTFPFLLALAPGFAHSGQYGGWGNPQPVSAINSIAAAEGCPIESPDGLALYFGRKATLSDPGDMYVSTRVRLTGNWRR